MATTSESSIDLLVSWNGNKYKLAINNDSNIGELKEYLRDVTEVLPERQKLIGLVKGKLPPDSTKLNTLKLKLPVHSVILMGSVEKDILREPTDLDRDIVNDLDIDYSIGDTADPLRNLSNLAALENTISKSKIHLINDLSPSKKLLVLDLDYTLFDCKSQVSHISQLARPGMHEMLTVLSQHYEFCIWSQTSWRWLEAKITELGMLTHPDYRIAFVLDQSFMFSIENEKDLKKKKHQVKALRVIWDNLPQYGPHNTIHIDDLGRNFAMNPQSGLKISVFKNAPVMKATDRELVHLTKYLLQLTLVPDFGKLNHKNWKKYKGPLPKDD
ncbi:HAD-like domain-containing protein [Globomyces pollinis-pini]|nr:HAD-like domain-containing protein [Globomyces pollinis-pini]